MEPKFARLVGMAGESISKTVKITFEKDYPFKILKVKARKGKDISVKLEEFNKESEHGYLLTVENRKAEAGRYADSLILTTDSEIKPSLTIPVYGQIQADKSAEGKTEAVSSKGKQVKE